MTKPRLAMLAGREKILKDQFYLEEEFEILE